MNSYNSAVDGDNKRSMQQVPSRSDFNNINATKFQKNKQRVYIFQSIPINISLKVLSLITQINENYEYKSTKIIRHPTFWPAWTFLTEPSAQRKGSALIRQSWNTQNIGVCSPELRPCKTMWSLEGFFSKMSKWVPAASPKFVEVSLMNHPDSFWPCETNKCPKQTQCPWRNAIQVCELGTIWWTWNVSWYELRPQGGPNSY